MDEIKGIARVKFHPGKVEEWKRLTEEAMHIVRTKDRGTLQYEIFFNEDESEAIVFERYRDADAGDRLGHRRGAGNAEREDEGAARRQGRPEAVHALAGDAGGTGAVGRLI